MESSYSIYQTLFLICPALQCWQVGTRVTSFLSTLGEGTVCDNQLSRANSRCHNHAWHTSILYCKKQMIELLIRRPIDWTEVHDWLLILIT